MSNKFTDGKLRGDRKDKKRRTPEGPPWLCAALEILPASARFTWLSLMNDVHVRYAVPAMAKDALLGTCD